MSIFRINCQRCGEEHDEPGALLFAPPIGGLSQKFHLCVECFHRLKRWLRYNKKRP